MLVALLVLAGGLGGGALGAQAVISRQVQHLARMTDDLLDAARAMTGKIVLQRQSLDLGEAAARALATLRAAGRTGRRRLAQQLEPVWIDADPTRIEQILGNLLGNALKFTPEGGTITVSVAKEGDDAVLRVSDTGVGMSRELSARVGMMEPTTVIALRSMEKAGLIRRVRSAEDKRKAEVWLTPKAKRMRGELLKVARSVTVEAEVGIAPDDIHVAQRVLAQMTANLDRIKR